MAIIYYPQGTKIEERNTASGSKVVESLNVAPGNVVFYFDETGSFTSQSIQADSASYAVSASWAPATPSDYSISSSWASQSLSASWAPTGNVTIDSASFLNTGSNIQHIDEGWGLQNGEFNLDITDKKMSIIGYIQITGSGGLIGTASYASQSVSAAFAEQALSASWAPQAPASNTASYLKTTGSIHTGFEIGTELTCSGVKIAPLYPFVTGSSYTIFIPKTSSDTAGQVLATLDPAGQIVTPSWGDLVDIDGVRFTNAIITGSLKGNLNGTASWANSASWAPTPRLVTSSSLTDKVLTENAAIDGNLYPALFTAQGPSYEYVYNTNNVLINPAQGAITATVVSASLHGTASYANKALSASYAPSIPSQYATSASWASASINSETASFSNYSQVAGYATSALSASYAPSSPSEYATSASWASHSFSASYANTSSWWDAPLNQMGQFAIEDFSKYPVGPLTSSTGGWNWNGNGVLISCSIVQVPDKDGNLVNKLRMFSGSSYSRTWGWGSDWTRMMGCWLVSYPYDPAPTSSAATTVVYQDSSSYFGPLLMGFANGNTGWNDPACSFTTGVSFFGNSTAANYTNPANRFLNRKFVVSEFQTCSYMQSANRPGLIWRTGSNQVANVVAFALANMPATPAIGCQTYNMQTGVTSSLTSPIWLYLVKNKSVAYNTSAGLTTNVIYGTWNDSTVSFPATWRFVRPSIQSMTKVMPLYTPDGASMLCDAFVSAAGSQTVTNNMRLFEGTMSLDSVNISNSQNWALSGSMPDYPITASIDVDAIIVYKYF